MAFSSKLLRISILNSLNSARMTREQNNFCTGFCVLDIFDPCRGILPIKMEYCKKLSRKNHTASS